MKQRSKARQPRPPESQGKPGAVPKTSAGEPEERPAVMPGMPTAQDDPDETETPPLPFPAVQQK